MTCIVGLSTEDGTVSIGGDSAGTTDSGIQTILDDSKVFFLRTPEERDSSMLVGGTTSFRFLNLLQHTFVVPAYDERLSPKRYLVTLFVDALRDALKTSGFTRKDKDDGEECGGEFLLGWRGTLFHIAEDYQVAIPKIGYHAIGSGARYALGALFATRQVALSPEQRLQLALEAAAYHSDGVRAPFVIQSTNQREKDR